MVEAGVAPETLVGIEREASFLDLLAARFPGVRVVRGDARSLTRLLERNQVGPVKAVVWRYRRSSPAPGLPRAA